MSADPAITIRVAGPADAAALGALRRAWTAEQDGDVADETFEARFAEWYERAGEHRVTWVAEDAGQPVGMMNLAVFERMPRPGRDAGTWGYLANAFILASHRNRGLGSMLLAAVLRHADTNGYVRVVLRPSRRAVPFYERAGFSVDGGLLVRHLPGDRPLR